MNALSPLFHLVAFILSLFRKSNRQRTWELIVRLLTPLTPRQIEMLRRAKREGEWYQPRRVALGNNVYRRAEHGESGGTRYNIFKTTLTDLSDFGLGISGYFAYLYGLILACGIMSLVSLPSMFYFESSAYGDGSKPFYLFGSAVCTSSTEVQAVREGANVTLVKSNCPYTENLGLRGLGSVSVFCVCIYGLRVWMNTIMAHLDEVTQTAQDYSVEVHDPDSDGR
jgi:hypothetical protein